MNVTIAICTRNRAKPLARTLESVAAMSAPRDARWEVLVVDNGSTDETPAVIHSFKSVLPIRGEFESKSGVSNARNRAVAEAAGDYIVWTDDDVLVDREWLRAYVAAFHRWPDAVLFGGKTLPLFEGAVPDWLSETFDLIGGVFAFRDFGDAPVQFTLEGRRIPFGTNYAMRTAEHRSHPFNPDLGPRPGDAIYGEETDVIEAVLRSGKTGYWVPEAKVQHCIPQDRMTLAYIDKYYLGYGRYLAYSDRKLRVPRLCGVPRWLWRRVAVDAIRYGVRRPILPPTDWMKFRIGYDVDRGMLEYYRRSRPS